MVIRAGVSLSCQRVVATSTCKLSRMWVWSYDWSEQDVGVWDERGWVWS